MAKRSKEWREKISRGITQKWKDKEYRQKQDEAHHSEQHRIDRSKEMKGKWQTDAFKERMTGENHPNWNPNREEVERDYGPGWYSEIEKQREVLREEQGNRDGLTGEKFKEDDVIVRHHIDYDKYNNQLDNLCALTPKTHALVTNESGMSKDEYMKTFQEGKENLKQNTPPEHWDEKNKEEYKNDIKQENNPISENFGEERKEEKKENMIDEIDTKEPISSKDNTNEEKKEEKPKDSKQDSDKDENQTEEKDRDVNDKKSEESVEENQEENPEDSNEKPEEESKAEKEKDSQEGNILAETQGGPTEEHLDKPDNQQEASSEKIGGIKSESKDYSGIVQPNSNKSDEYKGIDSPINDVDKDYNGIDGNFREESNDFDGIDTPQEKGDRDFDNIDDSYPEGSMESGGGP